MPGTGEEEAGSCIGLAPDKVDVGAVAPRLDGPSGDLVLLEKLDGPKARVEGLVPAPPPGIGTLGGGLPEPVRLMLLVGPLDMG